MSSRALPADILFMSFDYPLRAQQPFSQIAVAAH
jgi:hypothetical protein